MQPLEDVCLLAMRGLMLCHDSLLAVGLGPMFGFCSMDALAGLLSAQPGLGFGLMFGFCFMDALAGLPPPRPG